MAIEYFFTKCLFVLVKEPATHFAQGLDNMFSFDECSGVSIYMVPIYLPARPTGRLSDCD
eukprot:COSAG06_NODE_3493_length_5269_cov_2.970793_2_plen_60_part_00